MRIPIVLDTDIGTDIDDAYALVFAAVSPELELTAVTTVNHDVSLRARIAIELLRRLGREHVPVAAGCSNAIAPGANRGWLGHEGVGIDLAPVSRERHVDARHAARLIADEARRARESGRPLTLVTIGALTNAATAIRDYPQEMTGLAGIVAMASNFAGYGQEKAGPEHNVACDPDALQIVLDSGIALVLIGLNVTCQTAMTAADLARVEAVGGSLAEALAGMHRVWFELLGRGRSPMHDALAVAAVFDESLVRLERMSARVTTEDSESPLFGAVEFNPINHGQVTSVRVATGVDVESFHRLFFARVEQAVARCI